MFLSEATYRYIRHFKFTSVQNLATFFHIDYILITNFDALIIIYS